MGIISSAMTNDSPADCVAVELSASTMRCATGSLSNSRFRSANVRVENPTAARNGSSATTISLFALMSLNERSGALSGMPARFSSLNPARA